MRLTRLAKWEMFLRVEDLFAGLGLQGDVIKRALQRSRILRGLHVPLKRIVCCLKTEVRETRAPHRRLFQSIEYGEEHGVECLFQHSSRPVNVTGGKSYGQTKYSI